ncbi:hypothetical protein TWF281_000329 [Arthrobotrys megalospora]
MTTMLKRILKGGRDRQSKDFTNSRDQNNYPAGSAFPVEYNGRGPPNVSSTSSAWSNAVDYDRSPPDVTSLTSSTTSAVPVDYERVRPDVDPYMSSSYRSPTKSRDNSPINPTPKYTYPNPRNSYPMDSVGAAVLYNDSAPRHNVPMDTVGMVDYNSLGPTASEYSQYSSGRQATHAPAAYNSVPPQQPSEQERRAQYSPTQYSPAQYEFPSTGPPVSPAGVDYGRQAPQPQSPYSHELGPPTSPGMVSYGQTPVEGYTSIDARVQPQPQPQPTVQQYPSYRNPGENVENQRPPYNYQEHNYVPSGSTSPSTPKYVHHNEAQKTQTRFENNAYSESGKSSASSLYSPPYSTVSNSTAPTSVYTPDRPNFAGQNSPTTYNAPPLPPRNQNAAFSDSTATSGGDDPNVSKFTVRLFCQRKREEGDTHEESPRDIREFRLANLALIKLAAGGERYVLLDAVFGELDKAIAPLLEKHWYLTQSTTVEDHFVPGGKNVVAIGKIMVAYKGTQSTLYADFKKDDEYARFKLEMEYAMNTIRNNNPVGNEKEIKYRY